MPHKNDKDKKSTIRDFSVDKLNKFTVSMQRSVNADGPMGEVFSVYALYTAFGQFLYRTGFQVEYWMLCASRLTSKWSKISWDFTKKVLKKSLDLFVKLLKFLTQDLLIVLQKIKDAFINVRNIIKHESELGTKHILKQIIKYIAVGIHKHRSLWLSLASYLLPICALGIFIYTANQLLNYTFALEVDYNGETIGQIANELVFEDAQDLVRGRIRTTGSEENFTVVPTITLKVTNDVLTSRETLADNIIRTSQDQIQEATGILIDGELLGVTIDGAMLRSTLDEILSKYLNPEKPDMRAEFVKNVELIDGLYYTASLTETNQILNTLTGEIEGQKIYEVQKGDSPLIIAQKNGIVLKELYALNPQMEEKGYRMPIGDQLIVSKQENFLQVKTIEPIVYEEEISFPVEQEKTDSLFEKQKKIVQKGVKGVDRVSAEVVSIDGVAIETIELNRETLSAPVPQKEQIGTKSLASAGASAVGTGSMMFPVPNRTAITTKFGQGGHRGIDITAAYGTPVYACDSGTVVEAGWHYSWGNYIKISHGNGLSTLYAHNSALYVGAGQVVARGTPIAAVGSTGNSSGNHCHLEIYSGGRLINPLSVVG